jgi:RNA polymerase sigma-70 factor, ECF subfamily
MRNRHSHGAPRRPTTRAGAVAENTEQQTVGRHPVQAALRTLSVEHRQVLLECYFHGASVAEAARTLLVPPGTIKSRIHYALHALHKAIAETCAIA